MTHRTDSRNSRTRLPLAVVLVLSTALGTVRGEDVYPSRPIKLVVPFSAGGGTDTFARIFKAAIDKYQTLPQPMVVVNLNGAGATIGSRRVKNAVPDGYTVLILHEAIVTAKYAGTVNYGPEAFTPVAQTGQIGMVIAVRDDSEYEDLKHLMTAARERPDEILFAANLGAPSHFAGLLLEEKVPGAAFRYTQYGGGSERFAAIRGDHVQTSAFSLAEYMQFKDGENALRALAYFGEQRHPEIPEIPTAKEQGINYVSQNQMIWWVPKGTPADRVETLAAALEATLQTPDVQAQLGKLLYDPVYLKGAELDRQISQLTAEIALVKPRKPVGLPNFALIITSALAITAIAAAFQAVKRRRRAAAVAATTGGVQHTPAKPTELLPVIGVALCLLAYVTVLSQAWVGFAPATLVFVMAVVGILSRRRAVDFGLAVTLGLVLSYGIQWTLSSYFQVMLP